MLIPVKVLSEKESTEIKKTIDESLKAYNTLCKLNIFLYNDETTKKFFNAVIDESFNSYMDNFHILLNTITDMARYIDDLEHDVKFKNDNELIIKIKELEKENEFLKSKIESIKNYLNGGVNPNV